LRPKRDEVVRGIEQAFEDASMPRTKEELAPPSIEARYVIDHFFGKTRDVVESETFLSSLYMEDFTYMTDAAVLYYLPSVLRIMLANSNDDELWIYLHGFLGQIDGKYPNPVLTTLSVAQRSAIADWAESLTSEWEVHEWMCRFSKEVAELARKYRAAETSGRPSPSS
jgi:hypothetical protein